MKKWLSSLAWALVLVSFTNVLFGMTREEYERQLLEFQKQRHEAFLVRQAEEKRLEEERLERERKEQEQLEAQLKEAIAQASKHNKPLPPAAKVVEKEIKRGDAKLKLNVRPLIPPSRPQVPLKFSINMVEFDGYDIPQASVAGPFINWQNQPSPVIAVALDKGKAALAFQLPLRADVRLELFTYGKFELFPNLSPENILGYIEGLKYSHKGALVVLNENTATELTDVTFLDKPSAKVEYQLKLPEDRTLRLVDYFFIYGEQLILVRFSAPQELYDANVTDFIRYMESFTEASR